MLLWVHCESGLRFGEIQQMCSFSPCSGGCQLAHELLGQRVRLAGSLRGRKKARIFHFRIAITMCEVTVRKPNKRSDWLGVTALHRCIVPKHPSVLFSILFLLYLVYCFSLTNATSAKKQTRREHGSFRGFLKYLFIYYNCFLAPEHVAYY